MDIGAESSPRYPAVPLHVEYSLTDLGRSVSVPLSSLRTWVEARLHEIS